MQTGRKPVLIIGLSGNAREQYRQQALAAGMNECILAALNLQIISANTFFTLLL
jgi:hypothetical protein